VVFRAEGFQQKGGKDDGLTCQKLAGVLIGRVVVGGMVVIFIRTCNKTPPDRHIVRK
jgi:hypothetical protein